MNFIKNIQEKIFGKDKEMPLSRRILILMTFYTLFIAFAGNVVNIFLGFNILLILLTALAFFILIIFFLYARNSDKYEKSVIPLFLLSLLFISLIWFLNGGYDGNTVNLMFVYFIGIFTIFPKKHKYVVILSFISLFSALSIIQYLNPEYIVPYVSHQQRFADIILGNIIYFLFIFFMIDIIISNYSSENAKVYEAVKQLKIKNEQIEVSNRKLAESEEKFRMISDQLPDVLFLTDIKGIITYLSPATEAVFGRKPEEMTGHAFMEYLHKDEISTAVEHFQKAINLKENTSKLPLKIITAENNIKHIELNATSFYKDNQVIGTIGVLRDIHDRKLADEKILKLSKGIEQSPASVVITDINGTIEYVNTRFSETTGFSFDEAMGQNPRILFSGYQDQLFYENLWQRILSGEEWRGEIKNKRKNGELFWEYASIFPIKNEKGEIGHFVALKEDITLHKNMEAELIEAKNKAEESDKLKSAFLANMSHEIRTPLNGILGFINLLVKENITSDQKEKYNIIIKKSAKDLLQIINDILDISRIESGQMVMSKTTFEINHVIKDLQILYSSKLNELKKTSIELKMNLSDGNISITTDESRLRQIFVNLLDNAVKFTENGSIEFGIEEVNKKFIRLKVSDTGIGIPLKMQSLIFDRFRQVKTNDSAYRGNGLGLSIVKQLIEIMGGTITVKSKPGSGTSFYFSLPLKKSDLKVVEYKTKTEKLQVPSNLKILLVEDNDANRIFMEELLTLSGFSFEVAKTGKETLQMLEEMEYDIVLLDIQLPDMDGYELAAKIRLLNKNVRIIAQTAYAMSYDEEKALAAGCSDYISKPIDIDMLLSKIKDLYFGKANKTMM